MSKNRKHLKRRKPEELKTKKRIALVTRKLLIIVMSILIAFLVVLIFKIGIVFWPGWMVEYRKLLMTLASIVAIFLIFMFPVIVEANSDPRLLSGPGEADSP